VRTKSGALGEEGGRGGEKAYELSTSMRCTGMTKMPSLLVGSASTCSLKASKARRSATSPKSVYSPSRCGAGPSITEKDDPPEPGSAWRAIDSRPALSCLGQPSPFPASRGTRTAAAARCLASSGKRPPLLASASCATNPASTLKKWSVVYSPSSKSRRTCAAVLGATAGQSLSSRVPWAVWRTRVSRDWRGGEEEEEEEEE
jgi:hypothetical protein